MQCRVCGVQLPSGAGVCPNCGTPVVYNGNDTTIASTPVPESPVPPTVYGSPGAPPPPPGYNQPGPYSPYEPQSTPPAYNAGGNSYPGSVPNNYYPNSGVPPYQSGQHYMQPGQQMPPMAPNTPPRKSPWGWIAAGIIVAVVVVCVGASLFASNLIKTAATNPAPTTVAQSTATPGDTVTPTVSVGPTTDGVSPSGNPIDPLASKIIYDPKLSSAIDKDEFAPKPGTEKTTFKVNEQIYVSYKVDESQYTVSPQQKAYILTKYYAGSRSVLSKEDPLVVDSPVDRGYDSVQYFIATPQGAAEVYWCRKADCSDRKLAQVVHFTVESED